MAKVEREAAVSEELLRDFLREMLLIRRFEEKVEERFRAGELPGFLHVAIGQEAVAVGVCRALEDGDVFASTHRAHGHALARGTHPNAVMAELYGKVEGCSHGYGGSMHLYDVERGNLGANAVVGGGLPAITAPRSPSSSATSRASRSPSSATARRTPARSTSRSTSPSSGASRPSSCARTTAGRSRRRSEPALADRRHGRARERLGNARDQRRRAGRRGGLREGAGGARARALGPGPVFMNVVTVPARRPLHRRSAGLPAEGGVRELRESRDPIELLRDRARLSDDEFEALDREVTRSSTARSSSRRRAPIQSRKTPSRTSMPELSYREAVRDALSRAMREDESVFIMGEDIAEMGGSMGVTQGMVAEFGPERVRNTPISEMAIVGAGIGASMQGMRPVVEIMYEDFLTLSLEQIVNQAAKHRYMSGGQLKIPLTIRTQGGAGWSPGAQHAQQLEAWLVHIPGLKVVFASTPTDVRGLLWTSIYDDNPVIFFEHRTLYGLKEEVPEELEPIPLGKARIHREGEDVTVVATGRLVHEALAAAKEAEEEGISVEVFDPRTLQPLDEQALLDSVKKTNRCVVAHEAVTRMGYGAEIAAVVQYGAFDWLDAPIERVGAKFTPLPFAPVMEEFVIPHAADVLEAIKRTVGRNGN